VVADECGGSPGAAGVLTGKDALRRDSRGVLSFKDDFSRHSRGVLSFKDDFSRASRGALSFKDDFSRDSRGVCHLKMTFRVIHEAFCHLKMTFGLIHEARCHSRHASRSARAASMIAVMVAERGIHTPAPTRIAAARNQSSGLVLILDTSSKTARFCEVHRRSVLPADSTT
jgi:hypothetical protein